MAAIQLNREGVSALKKALRDDLPDVGSSHADQAIAFSLGFSTHAALLAHLGGTPEGGHTLVDEERLVQRLQGLGYERDPEFDLEALAGKPVDGAPLVIAKHHSAYEIDMHSQRRRAWRNLKISAVNAALDQSLFGLRVGQNWFKDYQTFDFTLPNGLPARGSISDAGFDEVSIHAAVNPNGDSVRAYNAGFDAGDAFGITWIERRQGVWLQTSESGFRCRRRLLQPLADLEVTPEGYGDRGRVIV